jgi:hypothetical protein
MRCTFMWLAAYIHCLIERGSDASAVRGPLTLTSLPNPTFAYLRCCDVPRTTPTRAMVHHHPCVGVSPPPGVSPRKATPALHARDEVAPQTRDKLPQAPPAGGAHHDRPLTVSGSVAAAPTGSLPGSWDCVGHNRALRPAGLRCRRCLSPRRASPQPGVWAPLRQPHVTQHGR